MTDLVTTARTARERLAAGLNALQNPALPESLQSAAEPIAMAMSALHQIERIGVLPVSAGGPNASPDEPFHPAAEVAGKRWQNSNRSIRIIRR